MKYFMKYFRAKNFMKFYITNWKPAQTSLNENKNIFI